MAKNSKNPEVIQKWKSNEIKNRRSSGLSDKEANQKKFKNVKNITLQKLSKITHNFLDRGKELTSDKSYKTFYDYVKENAKQHEPLTEEGVDYRRTYDMNDLYDKWKNQFKREKVESYQEEELPTEWFELPQPKKAVNSDNVVVVDVNDVNKEEKKEEKKDEEDQKVVLGRFENPKDEFQAEINKMVDFAVKYFHFNDLISDVLKPEFNPHRHSSTWSVIDMCSMYYYILQYKIPILDLNETQDVRYYKNLGERQRQQSTFSSQEAYDAYLRERDRLTEKTTIKLYNDMGRVVDYAVSTKEGKSHISMICDQIKLHLSKGEKQIVLYFGIGAKGHGHQNLILVRSVEKKLYIIDPHGTQSSKALEPSYKKQAKVMEMIGKNIGFEVVGSADTCPYVYKDVRKGFQAIENLAGQKYGMCGWWSNFIIELCCLKSDTPFPQLYKEASDLLSDKPQVLFNVVMKYQYNLQQIILDIAKKAGLNIGVSPIDNVYDSIAVILSRRIGNILEKRMKILGYGN